MERRIFGKIDWILIVITMVFLLSSLALFYLEQSNFLATIFAFLGLLLVGLTVGTSSAKISKFVAKKLKMHEKFANVTIDELRREDEILLQGTGILQALILFYVNLVQKIAESYILNALIIFSGIIFYVIRAHAKLKDSNKSRYNSILVLFVLAYIDLIIIMLILNIDTQITYLVDTIGIFIASLGIATLRYRYIRVENQNAQQEIIEEQTDDALQSLEPVKEIETIYDVVSKRFEFEMDRAKDLDSKAYYLIGFVGIISTLITGFGSNYLTLPIIEELSLNLLFLLSPIISFVVVLIFFFSAFIFGLQALQIKEYTIVPNAFNLIGAYANAEKQRILQDLTDDYAIAIDDNMEVSNKKANSIKNAVWCLFFALFALLFHAIFLLFA